MSTPSTQLPGTAQKQPPPSALTPRRTETERARIVPTPRHARQVESVKAESLDLKKVEHAHEQATHLAEQGWIGKICGSRGENAGNIAFLAIVACFMVIAGAALRFGLTEEFFKLLSVLSSVISLALGYLFGSHKNKP